MTDSGRFRVLPARGWPPSPCSLQPEAPGCIGWRSGRPGAGSENSPAVILGLPRLIIPLVLLAVADPALAQGIPADTVPPAGACWRFSFGAWDPPLRWTEAGHPGSADTMAARVRRIRDSVFARDAGAASSNAMLWSWTPRGWTLLLFPPWWPVGVEIRFAEIRADDVEIAGEAVALVGDAAQVASRTTARGARCR